mmetsp:Transcript_14642/g.47863  ORF Transcript_14642/g.47863 Transcript_14642/m.47863 type:complete len:326 (+) Transcript_14642:250-1227(+)
MRESLVLLLDRAAAISMVPGRRRRPHRTTEGEARSRRAERSVTGRKGAGVGEPDRQPGSPASASAERRGTPEVLGVGERGHVRVGRRRRADAAAALVAELGRAVVSGSRGRAGDGLAAAARVAGLRAGAGAVHVGDPGDARRRADKPVGAAQQYPRCVGDAGAHATGPSGQPDARSPTAGGHGSECAHDGAVVGPGRRDVKVPAPVLWSGPGRTATAAADRRRYSHARDLRRRFRRRCRGQPSGVHDQPKPAHPGRVRAAGCEAGGHGQRAAAHGATGRGQRRRHTGANQRLHRVGEAEHLPLPPRQSRRRPSGGGRRDGFACGG